MSDQPIEGAVRNGPPPADAMRPEAVIRAEDGEIVGAVVHLPDGRVVEVTAPDPASIGPEPLPDFTADRLHYATTLRWVYGSPYVHTSDLIRITGT